MLHKLSKNKRKIKDTVEEVLIYVDIESTSMSESQIHEAVHLKMVGNDNKLLLQVNNKFFEGDFDFSIGTHVFFDEDAAVNDPFFKQCNLSYKIIAEKTNKILKMNRVLLKDHQQAEEEEEEDEKPNGKIEKDLSELKLSRTYEEAINLFLPLGKNPPRKVTEEKAKAQYQPMKESLE